MEKDGVGAPVVGRGVAVRPGPTGSSRWYPVVDSRRGAGAGHGLPSEEEPALPDPFVVSAARRGHPAARQRSRLGRLTPQVTAAAAPDGRTGLTGDRAVTFDAGGTLIHWLSHPSERFGTLCRLAGIPLPEGTSLVSARACARYQQEHPSPGDVGDAGRDWWRGLDVSGLRAAGVTGDLVGMADRMIATARALLPTWVVDPDVPAVLDALRARGVVLAVVSNWDGDLQGRLAALGIAGYFAFIADSGVIGVRKPDADIYRTTCAVIGVPPQRCTHVGDRPDTDCAVARAAGAMPVLYDPLDCWQGPDVRVRRLLDLLAVL